MDQTQLWYFEVKGRNMVKNYNFSENQPICETKIFESAKVLPKFGLLGQSFKKDCPNLIESIPLSIGLLQSDYLVPSMRDT